jgi:hypothetical protein
MFLLCIDVFDVLFSLFQLGAILTIPISVYLLNKFIDRLQLRIPKTTEQ